MNAAGIDVSSRKSTVTVLRPFGEVVKLPFDMRHSAEDLAALAEQLKSIEGETRVVMEHTGRYYESVAKVLHEAGLYVSAVNPLLIKEYGNNSLRKVKTDKGDLAQRGDLPQQDEQAGLLAPGVPGRHGNVRRRGIPRPAAHGGDRRRTPL